MLNEDYVELTNRKNVLEGKVGFLPEDARGFALVEIGQRFSDATSSLLGIYKRGYSLDRDLARDNILYNANAGYRELVNDFNVKLIALGDVVNRTKIRYSRRANRVNGG